MKSVRCVISESTLVAIGMVSLGINGTVSAAEDSPPAGLEEIVVTATKTGQTSLQSTPIAITAFTADDLSQRAIENISGVIANTPGVVLSDLGGYSQIFIRGVGSNTVYVGSDPSSTVHIDGVYQARPLSYLTDFLDVDRVEVLMGPQGTLYGRNSVGGTINVISRAPSPTETGEAQVSAGNYGEVGVKAYISGPLTDSGILGSIAVSRLKHDAYLDNVSTGGGVEAADHYATRGQLLFPLGSDASLTLRGNYAHSNDSFGGAPKLLVPDGIPLDDSVIGNYQKIALNLPTFSSLTEYGFSADFTYHISPDTTLKSLSAFQNFGGSLGYDADGSSLNVIFTQQDPIRQHQLSEELNLSGDLEKLTYVVGAYYFTENDAEPLAVQLPSFSATDLNNGKIVDQSEALYGQAEYHFTSEFSAIAGLRYTHEKKDYAQENAYHASGSLDIADDAAAPVIGAPYFPDPFSVNTSRSDKAWTPKFGVDYHPYANVLTYVSATKGFKSGGYDFGSPGAAAAEKGYNPEYLWAYEVGVKSDWLDHRLRANFDAFLYRYSDMQVEVFLPPANAITENAASAKIKGVETELSTRPLPELELFATVAYLHARYLDFPGAYVTAFGDFNASGKALNNSPDWSSAVGATYTLQLAHEWGSAFIGSDFHWQSKDFFTPANDGVGGVSGYAEQQPGYGVLNARFGWKSPDQKWTVEVIGLNVADRGYITSTADYGVGISGRPGDPRTVRAQVDFKF